MMNALGFLASEKWTPLAEALLHSIWQGALVAFLLFLHLRVVPAKKPQLRYAGAIAAMISVLIGGFLTWAYLAHNSGHATGAETLAPSAVLEQVSNSGPAENDVLASPSAPETPSENSGRKGLQNILLFLWIIGVDIMLIRLSLALADLDNLRQNSRPPADSKLVRQIDSLLRRSRTSVTRLKVLVSDQLPSPVAFGFLRPTIVIPLSLATKSPPLLLEAILAHELAHIQRHDYLVNLGQLVIETLLFFNPAVWWISYQIRSEREACCDSDAAKLIGDEIDYAGALADYAASAPKTTIATALPFGKGHGEGNLTDRIRRLLIPNYKPTLKLPVGAVTLFFGVSALILFGLHQGSKMAVAVGAEWLSPEARIAKIKAIQESHPLVAPSAVYNEQLAQQTESRVHLFGVIKTDDGSPLLTDGLTIQADSRRPNYSSSHALGYQDGTFSGRVQPGQMFISAYSPHYAASLQGPFRGEIAGAFTNLTIKMKQGFTGKIKIENEQGAPITDAELYGSYDFSSYASIPETRSDSNGMAVLPNLIYHPMKLSLRAKGYQEDHRTITLDGTSPANWILNPAVPTSVTLVDDEGSPISGATARLVRMEGFQNMSFGGRTRPLYARSDTQGRLTFTELRNDSRYWFEVNAEGYGKSILRKLTAGIEDVRMTLRQPLVVHGQIEGDLSLLKQRNRNLDGKRQKWPTIRYSNPLTIENFTDSDNDFVFVETEGEKATFTIEDLWPGEITITAGPQSITLPLRNSPNEIYFNLDSILATSPPPTEALPPLAKREVQFNFITPPNQPKANGFAQANISTKKADGTYDYQTLTLQVENGSARNTVAVGSRIRIEPNHFPGYWFASASEGEIPVGEGPYNIDLTCFPAGAIYGNIREADGRPAVGIMISIVEVTKAPNRPKGSLDIDIKNGSSSTDQTETFTATPLPIGGTYVIVAHRDTSYAVSPHIIISQENPIQETDLIMHPGISVHGQVFQPNGEPAAGLSFDHSYNPVPNHGFSTSNKTTDRLGRFTLRGVTPNLPGNYSIRFQENPGYQRHDLVYKPGGSPLLVHLKSGLRLSGRVIDSVTGWPIPGIEVYVLPRPYSPERTGHVEADSKTDKEGRFQFTTLDSEDYQLNTRGAKRASQNQPPVNASSPESGDLRVTLYEWSKQKPLPPKVHK